MRFTEDHPGRRREDRWNISSKIIFGPTFRRSEYFTTLLLFIFARTAIIFALASSALGKVKVKNTFFELRVRFFRAYIAGQGHRPAEGSEPAFAKVIHSLLLFLFLLQLVADIQHSVGHRYLDVLRLDARKPHLDHHGGVGLVQRM
jgi:F0F1-type ATP synthase membrane subunit a